MFNGYYRMKKYKFINLKEKPFLKEEAAEWFSSKWNVPKKAYLDCMTAYIDGDTDYVWHLEEKNILKWVDLMEEMGDMVEI